MRKAVFLAFFAALPLFAASEFPPSYRWRTITTEHFFIHFHQGEEALAQRTAGLAEIVHSRLSPLMGWTPSGRTHVVLVDNIDDANGSATPLPFNRIEIFVSTPGADPSSPIEYYDDWLTLVITHEYAHILHLDQARAFPAALRKVLGRGPFSFPNLLSPVWVIEGTATLVESRETDSGRLKGTFVDMALRTAAVENRWFTEAQAGGLMPAWPDGSTPYFYGSKFLDWIARTKGMDKLTGFLHDYSGNFVPFGVDASARATLGADMSALYRQWSDEQQRAYRDEAARLGPLTERRRLTALGFFTKYPLLSPDGTRIAFGHDGPYDWPAIRVIDRDGRELARRQVNTISPMSWSPDGSTIAFSQLEFRQSFSLLSDLYLWPVGARRARRLTRGGRLKDPAFTPDGRKLIAVENGGGRNRIVEVDVAGGDIRPLVSPADDTQFSEPAVSPDGSRIAVAEWRAGRIDVVVYSRDGQRIANLTESMQRATYASPHFAPDGETILFSGDVTGIPNIYAARGGEIRRLSNVYGGLFFPSTADGKTFVVSDYSSNGWDISTFTAAGDLPATPRTLAPPLQRPAVTDADPAAGSGRGYTTQPYSPWQSLRPRWWFPILGPGSTSAGGKEASIGALTSGADALGFHSYTAQVVETITEKRGNRLDYALQYAYNRLYPTFTLTAAHFVNDPGITIVRDGERTGYRERTRRLAADMDVPWLQYRWQTSAGIGLIRDDVASDLPFAFPEAGRAGIFTGALQGLRTSLSFNNAYDPAYAVSAENGLRAILSYENLSRALGSDASVRTLRADLRGYLGVPFARTPLGRHAAALRVAAGHTSGDFVLQRELRVGGTGAGYVVFDTTDFPVRGFDSGALRGQSAALASLEYRFPLVQIDRGPSGWPLFFNRLLGDVFADAGSAWDSRTITLPSITRQRSSAFGPDNTIASVGAEVGIDLVLGFIAPLRYRAGVAWRVRCPEDCGRRAQVYLSFGSSF